MAAGTIQQMADRVAGLMGEKLHVRGATLSDTLRRGGGRLPKAVRAEARFLETAAAQAQHPKLMVQIDDGRVAQAYDRGVVADADVYRVVTWGWGRGGGMSVWRMV